MVRQGNVRSLARAYSGFTALGGCGLDVQRTGGCNIQVAVVLGMTPMQERGGQRSGLLVIVDDDAATRDSLRELFEVAGHRAEAFASGDELLNAGVAQNAACLLMDVRLGAGEDGIVLLRRLRDAGNRTPVVVMTGHGDVPLAVRAMRAGAEDFVQKPYTAQRILEAVAGAQRSGADGARAAALVAGLTPRERQVLAKLVEGKGNKAVAADLDLSVRTVETYRAAIMDKLRVKSLPEMVRIALAAGLDPVKPEAVD